MLEVRSFQYTKLFHAKAKYFRSLEICVNLNAQLKTDINSPQCVP